MNLNRAMIIGNLTRDPEVKTTPSGQTVANFGVATNRVWTNAQGQKQEAVELFMDIQESLKGLAPEKQDEATDLAGKIALGITKQIEKIREEVHNVRHESFVQTEAGQFYLKAREMFPNLSVEDAMKGYEKFKGIQLESSYANKKQSKPSLDKDGKTVARLWGVKEEDMIKEKKRYDKLMSSGDPRMMRKAGEIEI